MKISIVQPDILWENKSGNLQKLEEMISGIYNNTDIVVLPEMFSTGFSMNPEDISENFRSETFKWMLNISEEGNFGICGSFIVKQNGYYFNRWVFVNPDKESWFYDKRHLFRMGKEDKKYSCGGKRVIVNFRGIRINPNICYDLRFPVWSRNRNDYDILFYVANWPESRIDVWNTLLKARAIENQCYVAGVNRVGYDNAGLRYSGDSVVIDPYGKIIAYLDKYSEGVVSAEISLNDLNDFRKKFPVWQDADNFSIDMHSSCNP